MLITSWYIQDNIAVKDIYKTSYFSLCVSDFWVVSFSEGIVLMVSSVQGKKNPKLYKVKKKKVSNNSYIFTFLLIISFQTESISVWNQRHLLKPSFFHWNHPLGGSSVNSPLREKWLEGWIYIFLNPLRNSDSFSQWIPRSGYISQSCPNLMSAQNPKLHIHFQGKEMWACGQKMSHRKLEDHHVPRLAG